MEENARVSLRAVRAILATLDEGSISRAAAALYASQPALSRVIKVTEESLGVCLFDRQSVGVVPNGQAGPIFDRFLRVRTQLEQASQELARFPEMKGALVPLYRRLALRHLRALVTTFDRGSATAAADSLGHSTTAVARAIRDVEALVGQPLFERRPGRLAPTEIGRCLVTHAKLVLHELRYVSEEMVARSGPLTGRVVIGSMPLSRTLLVPEAIGRLARQHPKLNFSIVEGTYSTLLDGLQCGDLDLLVGALRVPAPAKSVREEILFQAPLSIVVRRGHPLAGRGKVDLKDLASATWVVTRRGTPTHTHFDALFTDAGLAPPRDIVECGSLTATRALLLRNDWITIISRLQIYYEEQFGILEVLPIELPGSSRPIGITLRTDSPPPPAAAAFAATLREVSEEITRQPETEKPQFTRPPA